MNRSRPLRTQIATTAALALLAVAGLLIAFGELRISWLSERFAREEARGNATLVASIRDSEVAALQRLNRDIAADLTATLALAEVSDEAMAESATRIVALTDVFTPKPAILLIDEAGAVRITLRLDDEEARDIALRLAPELNAHRQQDRAMVREPGTLSLVAVAEVRRGSRVIGHVVSLTDFGARLAQFFDSAAAIGVRPRESETFMLTGEGALVEAAATRCCMPGPVVLPFAQNGRSFMASHTPIRGERGEPVADFITLREVTDADNRDRRLTLLIYVLAGVTILLSIGLLMRAVRIALRPLGAVVQLLRRMSGGESAITMKPFRSAREIETLADTVESFRSGMEAQKSLVALTEQLEGARRIQQSLLPHSFDLAAGQLDLFGAMRPAENVGGDFFDTFALDDGRVAIIVADVSGKGMGAALFAALASMALRSNARLLQDAVSIVEATNEELSLRNREDLFITVLFALVDPGTGEVEIVNAGHCPPFLMKQGTEPTLVDSAGDLVLGVMPGIPYERRRITLEPGETLLIYSDGFDEAQNRDGAFLGLEGARDAIAGCDLASAGAIVEHTLAEIIRFADGAPQADDITLFAVRYLSGVSQPTCVRPDA